MPIEFEHPEYLSLLVFALPAALLLWPGAGRGILFSRGEAARSLPSGWLGRSGLLRWFPDLLRTLALACVVFALAGPVRVEVVREFAEVGKGTVLAVDLSSSMLAEDMDGRSRMDVAREAAIRFARRRQLDELALVGFAGEALTRVPLTTDPEVIVHGVESLGVELVTNGTDISSAVVASVNRLLESEREGRVLVLLTDGAHNAAGVPPVATARAAASRGVRVHSISLMSPEQASEADLEVSGQGEQAAAATVLSALSAVTGGAYFRATGAAALDSIYSEIDRLEAPEPGTVEREARRPVRAWFLASALLILACGSLLHGSRLGIVP